jgi:hypothetical protein
MDLTSDAYSLGALGRIRRFMIGLALLAFLGLWLAFGGRIALGFALGCGISYLNFHWLKRIVDSVTERTVATGIGQSGRVIVIRFVLRYGALAVAAYAIVTISPPSLYGFFGGLFLPTAAILCEAAYELCRSSADIR